MTITSHCVDELWWKTWKLIQEGRLQASRDGDTKETCGYNAVFTDINHSFLCEPRRKLSAPYAAAEVLWYMSGSDDGRVLAQYAPQYTRFLHADGTAHGAYGKRWMGDASFRTVAMTPRMRNHPHGSQMAAAVSLLERDRDTRRCVITAWNAGDLLWALDGKEKDVPCTLSLQLLVREGRLCCIATMRSNDLWLGMPYDIFAFTCLQRLFAEKLGLKTGWYRHQVGSMHVYLRDWAKIDQQQAGYQPMRDQYITRPHDWKRSKDVDRTMGYAIETEAKIRKTGEVDLGKIDDEVGLGTMLGDLVLCCATRWTEERVERYVQSTALKEACHAYRRGRRRDGKDDAGERAAAKTQ